jgi:hypothetical protein
MTRSNQITDKIAAQIKAMKRRGDKNQDIAAWFGFNQGRISDVCGKNAKIQYRHIKPELADIPPPGPYDFGGGGIAQAYRSIVQVKQHWDAGELQPARAIFDGLYRSMGRPSATDDMIVSGAEIFYDDRGIPKP